MRSKNLDSLSEEMRKLLFTEFCLETQKHSINVKGENINILNYEYYVTINEIGDANFLKKFLQLTFSCYSTNSVQII